MDIGGVLSVSWMEGAGSHTRMNVCMGANLYVLASGSNGGQAILRRSKKNQVTKIDRRSLIV